jgi:hypothetical protein
LNEDIRRRHASSASSRRGHTVTPFTCPDFYLCQLQSAALLGKAVFLGVSVLLVAAALGGEPSTTASPCAPPMRSARAAPHPPQPPHHSSRAICRIACGYLAGLTAAVSRVILKCGERQAGDSSDEDPEEDVPLHGPDGEAYASA